MDFLGVLWADLSLDGGDFGHFVPSVLWFVRLLVSVLISSVGVVSAPRSALGTYTARSGRRGLVEPLLLTKL